MRVPVVQGTQVLMGSGGAGMEIGVIVNPIAGMGGSVGLKGTDGPSVLAEAWARGAKPLAGARARRALAVLADACPGARIVAGAGSLGACHFQGLKLSLVEVPTNGVEDAAATRSLAAAMAERGIPVVAFAGGDGTARDLMAAVGHRAAILGIPCGAKMHSGVFAVSPEAAGRVLASLASGSGGRIDYPEAEIMDVDEALLREGPAQFTPAWLRPDSANSAPDSVSERGAAADDESMLDALGREIAGEMEPGATYLIGPGTTAKRPAVALGIEGELLGVDVLRDRRLVARDVTGRAALQLACGTPLRIIVGVTGGQGFVFGRGNQQIGAEAIRRCWPDAVTILAGSAKLALLPQPWLLADTGEQALDAALSGYVRVRTGPQRSTMMRIGLPSANSAVAQ